MATENEWNRFACPKCKQPLVAKDMERIRQQFLHTQVGSVTFMKPEGWWNLSCGHRVESIVDRTSSPDRFNFQLVDRP